MLLFRLKLQGIFGLMSATTINLPDEHF